MMSRGAKWKEAARIARELEADSPTERPARGWLLWVAWLWLASAILLGLHVAAGPVEGVILGIGVGIGAGVVLDRWKCLHSEVASHPNGIHGYNRAQAALRKWSRVGGTGALALRVLPFHVVYRLLYGRDGQRNVIRLVVLLVGSIAVGIFYPAAVVGVWILALGLIASLVLRTIHVPTLLFLASSGEAAAVYRRRLEAVTGTNWVALLRSPSAPAGVPEHFAAAHRNDVWSLRDDDELRWREIVRDFLVHAALVVVRLNEDPGLVREELRLLDEVGGHFRVVVVATNSDIVREHAPQFADRWFTEEEVLRELASFLAHPRRVRKKLWGPTTVVPARVS
ncbi:MAG: hypothetical protein GC161_02415 [Planctomycetaceae bacterium]|nr:hypothetical protein [Planctomycetaceae bacterium]